MRALRLFEAGKCELAEVDDPAEGPDRVLVELLFAGVNPLDQLVLQRRVFPDAAVPRTLGCEGAGLLGGRPVMVHGYGVGLNQDGTFAERVSAPALAAFEVPEGLSLEQAAACGITGATAWRLFEMASPTRADRALVLAGAGAVGHALCSLLASAGVTTWAQVRRADAEPFVIASGAKPIVAETAESLPNALQGETPTLLFDCLGGDWTPRANSLLANDGRHFVFGASAGSNVQINLVDFYRRGASITGYRGVLEPPDRLRTSVERALQAVSRGALKLPTAACVPLSRATEALTRVGQTHQGKIVLDLRS